MEDFGRLTFPNSRTASPVIDRDLVITRGITANWGAQGPAADRFYAFEKKTGELVWASSPGDRPRDNSYSHPYLAWLGGKRVFFAATGDGSVVCVNARTGDPLWRVNLSKAGINATVLVHNNDKVIAVYGTPYEPGQMVALKIMDVAPTNAAAGPVVLEREKVELWADNYSTSSSSPILAGDTVYLVAEKGDLVAVEGLCFGTPTPYNGKIYIQTTRHLYCFGKKGSNAGVAAGESGALGTALPTSESPTAHGPAKSLQIIPSEVLLRPGQSVSF